MSAEARETVFRLDIRVTPKAARDRIDGWITGADGRPRLRLRVTAAPEKGKANRAACRLLAKALGVAPSGIEVVIGATDRDKTLQIAGDAAAIAERLRQQFEKGAA